MYVYNYSNYTILYTITIDVCTVGWVSRGRRGWILRTICDGCMYGNEAKEGDKFHFGNQLGDAEAVASADCGWYSYIHTYIHTDTKLQQEPYIHSHMN